MNKEYRWFFDEMKKYYDENHKEIRKAITDIEAGTDQTILNFMLDKHNVDVKVLPSCYNLQDLWRKNLIILDEKLQFWMKDELHFTDAGWVYHFNAIPPNKLERDQKYWIKRTFEELYG